MSAPIISVSAIGTTVKDRGELFLMNLRSISICLMKFLQFIEKEYEIFKPLINVQNVL